MRLASFKVKDRSSYGAVTDGGIIDLARKLEISAPLPPPGVELIVLHQP